MKDKKKTVAWGILILVAIVAIALNAYLHRKSTPSGIGEPLAIAPEVASTPLRTKSKDTLENTGHNYMGALAVYKDKRVQFAEDCTATPSRSVYAQGEKVLIDNRGNELRGVQIGSQNIVLKPYDFAVVTLFQKGTFGVNCGTLTNAATIIVQ